jgi:hypothetical protein
MFETARHGVSSVSASSAFAAVLSAPMTWPASASRRDMLQPRKLCSQCDGVKSFGALAFRRGVLVDAECPARYLRFRR